MGVIARTLHQGLEPLVAAAVLAASLLHASWHALVKSSGDRVIALAGMNVVSGGVALAIIPFVQLPPAMAFGVIALSVLLHAGYKVGLARVYGSSDLGQAYPVVRGITPVAAAALAFAFLGERPELPLLVGIALVSAGILALLYEPGRQGFSLRTTLIAIAAGLAVALYSVIDAYGVRLTGHWLAFTAWLVAADSICFVAYALATRRSAAVLAWRHQWVRTLVSGSLGVASFGIFMWALGRAAVGPVSALRETSIVFSALLGVVFLGERPSIARYAGAMTVTAGVMAIAWYR